MKDQLDTWIRNPMTIVALFVGLTETGLGIGLANVPPELKSHLVVSMSLLAGLCLVGFFIVLIFRPHHFYGPRDYRTDQSYLSIFGTTTSKDAADEARQGDSYSPPPKESMKPIIDGLEVELLFFLLKAAAKPAKHIEYIRMLDSELKLPLEHERERLFATAGYFRAVRRNLGGVFRVQYLPDKGQVVHLFPAARELIAERLAQGCQQGGAAEGVDQKGSHEEAKNETNE